MLLPLTQNNLKDVSQEMHEKSVDNFKKKRKKVLLRKKETLLYVRK